MTVDRDPGVTLLRADARALPLPDASVDLIVTSPPYFAQRSYQDAGGHMAGQIGDEDNPHRYLDQLEEATREWVRVLKPTGSLWVNLGDKYVSPGGHTDNTASSRLQGRRNLREQGRADRSTMTYGMPRKSLMGLPWRYALDCIDHLHLTLRAEVVWSKPNAQPESVSDRVKRSHEQWFHFTLGPRYFADVDPLRGEPSTYRRAAAARRTPPGQRRKALADSCNPDGSLPPSVWDVPTERPNIPKHLGDHYAAFPTELPRRIILGWSPPGGVVLDPFGGTGTVALVATVLGRRGISVDRSADYCRVAAWRTTDSGERARAMRVGVPVRQVFGQGDLFEYVSATG